MARLNALRENVLTDDLLSTDLGVNRTEIARRHTDNVESWLRTLVHNTLFGSDGTKYITAGNWKSHIKSSVKKKCDQDPEKYLREVDATTFGQLIEIVCSQDYWPKWSEGLSGAYPDGLSEARTFLQRLQLIRNDVSHGQICSGRQLEQAVCYSNDLADSIKDFYRRKGLDRQYNVPTFTKYYDNIGNTVHLAPGHHFRGLNFSDTGQRLLYPGDFLIAEVEVDPSFDTGDFGVIWWVKTASDKGQGTSAKIRIENKHVGERLELQFKLTTNRDWHRGGSYDDAIDIYYKVLPPVGI